MILPDSTMFLPLLVGMASLANVELSARTRKATARAVFAGEEARREEERRRKEEGKVVLNRGGRGRGMTNAVRKREMEREMELAGRGKRGEKEEEEEPRTARLITNALRGSSVAFIVIAAMSPAVSCRWV